MRILISTDNHLVRCCPAGALWRAAATSAAASPCAATPCSTALPITSRLPAWLQGVWEKDEIRKDDSFLSFEEVFEVAAANNADFVLLGGDLFHDNKPSRNTIVRLAGGPACCSAAAVGRYRGVY